MSERRDDAGGGGRLDGLDALRGIAALLVALGHIAYATGAGTWLGHFYLSVDMFFMLSGYVLARTYERRLEAGLSAARFLALRVKRLWPTMAVGATIGLVTFWGGNAPAASLTVFAMALLFVPGNDPMATFPTNPPAWSIGLELFANLAHALVLHRLGTVALAGIATLSVGALALWAPNMNVGGAWGDFGLGVARVLFAYCVGIMIWRLRGDRAALPGELGLLLLPLAIVAAGMLRGDGKLVDLVFVVLLCPVIVVSGIAAPRVARRPLRWLGTISFPLYAVHYPVTMLVTKAGFGAAVAIPAALATAALTWFALEGRNGWQAVRGNLAPA